MKKLMSLMLGLSIALGSFAMFAQDSTDTTKSTMKKKSRDQEAPRKTPPRPTRKANFGVVDWESRVASRNSDLRGTPVCLLL